MIALLRRTVRQEKKAQTLLCRTKLAHFHSGPKPTNLIIYWVSADVWTVFTFLLMHLVHKHHPSVCTGQVCAAEGRLAQERWFCPPGFAFSGS